MRPEITGKKITRKKIVSLPIAERFGVTVPVAASYSGISRSRIYELLAARRLVPSHSVNSITVPSGSRM